MRWAPARRHPNRLHPAACLPICLPHWQVVTPELNEAATLLLNTARELQAVSHFAAGPNARRAPKRLYCSLKEVRTGAGLAGA